MNQIACITSTSSIGATFVDWSVHFLSGRNIYYSIKEQQWIPLTVNPLTQSNSHNHKKNHPSGWHDTKLAIEILKTQSDFVSLYPYPLRAEKIAEILKITLKNLSVQDHASIVTYQHQDYKKLINECYQHDVKVVYIHCPNEVIGYKHHSRENQYSQYANDTNFINNEKQELLDNIFFNNCSWGDTIWDKREKMALNIRPFDSTVENSITIDLTQPHHWVNSQDLWHNGENTLIQILNFLKIKLDSNRLDAWRSIYHKWQQIQYKSLKFTYNYKHIVDAVVNNWYYDISNLTFIQEVIIQHCLIYQHGLNLKTWELEKFPDNTQDLHKLLEPNIHNVPCIY